MEQIQEYHSKCLKCSKMINEKVDEKIIKCSRNYDCSVKTGCEKCINECSEHILYCDYCLTKVHSRDLKKCLLTFCPEFCCKKCMKQCFGCLKSFNPCHMKFCEECYLIGYCYTCIDKYSSHCSCFKFMCENHRCLNCSVIFDSCQECQRYCKNCNSIRF
jgi:hypothetical protein